MSEYRLEAKQAQLGDDVSIGQRTLISAIGGPAERVEIGDNVFIGEDVRILAPRVTIGDYAIIHHHTTIYGYEDVTIGDCTWVGQNAILNCTSRLSIGRGCTISALANIWTHFSGGDPLAGCNFLSHKPACLGDDVWIGVQASIAPVNIGARAMVLAGAVVTKDIPQNRVFGGNPAQDLTDKLGPPYTDKPDEEKFAMLCDQLHSFQESLRDSKSMAAGGLANEFAAPPREGLLRIGNITIAMTDAEDDGTSVFDVRDRSYSKLRTPEEIGFMNFLLPLIKFYPRLGNRD